MSDSESKLTVSGCGCLLNLLFGGIATQYLVSTILHQSINFFMATLIGLIGGTVIIPGALIVWILTLCGINF
jgi:hypothetical protein